MCFCTMGVRFIKSCIFCVPLLGNGVPLTSRPSVKVFSRSTFEGSENLSLKKFNSLFIFSACWIRLCADVVVDDVMEVSSSASPFAIIAQSPKLSEKAVAVSTSLNLTANFSTFDSPSAKSLASHTQAFMLSPIASSFMSDVM